MQRLSAVDRTHMLFAKMGQSGGKSHSICSEARAPLHCKVAESVSSSCGRQVLTCATVVPLAVCRPRLRDGALSLPATHMHAA